MPMRSWLDVTRRAFHMRHTRTYGMIWIVTIDLLLRLSLRECVLLTYDALLLLLLQPLHLFASQFYKLISHIPTQYTTFCSRSACLTSRFLDVSKSCNEGFQGPGSKFGGVRIVSHAVSGTQPHVRSREPNHRVHQCLLGMSKPKADSNG